MSEIEGFNKLYKNYQRNTRLTNKKWMKSKPPSTVELIYFPNSKTLSKKKFTINDMNNSRSKNRPLPNMSQSTKEII